MVEVTYGGSGGTTFTLQESADMVVVRGKEAGPLLTRTTQRITHRLLQPFQEILSNDRLGLAIFKTTEPVRRHAMALRDRARRGFRNVPAVKFAGCVLHDPTDGVPVLYTENVFLKFHDDVPAAESLKRLEAAGLTVKQRVGYAKNAWHAAAADGIGQDVFGLAQELLASDAVEFCHPELLRPARKRRAYAPQWHLKKTKVRGKTISAHAHVVDAWKISRGKGVTIAIVDDGVDTTHPEFAGAGKVMHPRDVTRKRNAALPRYRSDNHGTACAGVACANGKKGASGVAPAARLMPIRFEADFLGAQSEADSFAWAAKKGADVISCSWGPTDGEWWNPKDPVHKQVVRLPDSTRLAIDYAVKKGRGGKGCVVVWAAGNGNESVDNDGYASYEKVIAVAACNDRNKRSGYSDFGKAIWCAFPSDDIEDANPRTPGIYTTDRTGASGYNPDPDAMPGKAQPRNEDFTNSFGGTSSACPGVAGVAALVLGVNPALRWDEVRDILRRSCDKIDRSGGRYNKHGRSRTYGYGRVNARKAVERAKATLP